MLREAFDERPRGHARVDELLGGGPVDDALLEGLRVVADARELVVADTRADVLDVGDRGRRRQRSVTAGRTSKGGELLEEDRRLRQLLARLAAHPERLEHLADGELLGDRERDLLDAELGLRDLVLVELPGREHRTVQRGRDVLRAVQRDECGVDGVLRPAIGARTQHLADLDADLARADGREHRLADWVFFRRDRVAHRLERLVCAFLRALDDSLPRDVVGLLEAREEPYERGVGCLANALLERRLQQLGAAALEHLGVGDDLLDELVALANRPVATALHAVLRLFALAGRGRALGVDGLLRGLGIDDQLAQLIGRLARQEDEDRGTVGARRTRGVEQLLLAHGPAVPNPQRDALAVAGRRRLVTRDDDLAGLLRGALQDLHRADDAVGLGVDLLVTADLDVGVVVGELALAAPELGVPLGALLGLETVLVTDLHQRAARCQLLEQRLDGAAQLAVVGEQVVDEQVGDVLLRGTHADVGACLARQPADEEHEPADPPRELALVGSVLREIDDPLVDLAKEHTRVDHLRGERLEQVIARNGRTETTVGEPRDGVVDDAELRAELAVRSGRVDRAEAVLPEAAAHRQERVVVDDDVAVLRALTDARALELARNLAAVLLQEVLHRRDRRGLLLQEHLADDGLDVLVGELDADGVAVGQLLQLGRRGERALARGDDEHVAVELLRKRFGHFGDERRAVVGVADVLLHLVEDEQRARGTSVAADELQHALDGGEELLGRDVGATRRELRLQRVARLGLGGREARVAREKRVGDVLADVEVVQLGRPLLPRAFDSALHLVEPALIVEPQAELRLRVLVGQSSAAQEHREDRQANVIGCAAREGAGRREQTARALARGVELAEQLTQLVGHRRHEASRRGAVGELGVLP